MNRLAAELLRFDKDAEDTYANIIAKEDSILANARQQAMSIIQEAEQRRGKDREDALSAHQALMERRKKEILTKARAIAEKVRVTALSKKETAATYVIDAVIAEAKL